MSVLSKSIAVIAGSTFFAAAAWADTISPSSYSTTLAVGGSTTITKTVTVEPSLTTGMVDIFFLADTTGSMLGAINNVKANASTLLTATSGLGDVQWGVGSYRDAGDIYTYQTEQTFTSNTALVTTGINSWAAGGGGDWEEAQLNALTQVAGLAWRPGALHLAVWFGDAPGHDPSVGGATLGSTTAALVGAGIKVEAIDVGSMDYYGQASSIATATGGNYFSGFSGGVTTAILDAIKKTVSNYSKVCLDTTLAPAGVTVVADACQTGTWDRSISRDFTFGVKFTGDAPGTYEFPIYATVDGARVAREADRIVVTESVPEPGMLLLMGAAFGAMGIARRNRKH